MGESPPADINPSEALTFPGAHRSKIAWRAGQAMESPANIREALPLRVVSAREISGAHAVFTYEAYAKEMGDELKALFANPPEGVSVVDYEPEEKVEPEGKGIEACAPLHHYELKAKGRITGAARPLIDFYARLEQHPLVAPEEIVLEFR